VSNTYADQLADLIEEFDPNAESDERPQWATFTPSSIRRLKFKLHRTRALALGSFTGSSNAILYQLSDGRWIERARKVARDTPEMCDHCGGSTVNSTYGRYNNGRYEFEKRGSRVTDDLNLRFLCSACRV
jgi:hypothetical protein